MTSAQPLVICIGASAGGVEALLTLAGALPRDIPAVVCVVLHVGPHSSILPELLRSRGPLPALHPKDGQHLQPGAIYVAPPNNHLLLDRDIARLSRGARENLARPAIDPLFRSAAVHWRERAVGVVLTGRLDDGAAGIAAIKAAGGTAVVQNPADAIEPEMPLAALAAASIDACLPLGDIAPYLAQLARAGTQLPSVPLPERLSQELAINFGSLDMSHLERIADVSSLTCPDCGGSLFEVREQPPLRYRCHTGHAFTAGSLAHGQSQATNAHLAGGVRSLRERAMLLRRMMSVAQGTGDAAQAATIQAQADRLWRQANELELLLEEEISNEDKGGSA
ncbi:MAG: chemotaxis protein CheB [Lysobacter sp.]|nr:chemotaxis protein CheB [Lysobacter sp.]